MLEEVVDQPPGLQNAQGSLQLPVHRNDWAGYAISRHKSSRFHKADELPVQRPGVETEIEESQ